MNFARVFNREISERILSGLEKHGGQSSGIKNFFALESLDEISSYIKKDFPDNFFSPEEKNDMPSVLESHDTIISGFFNSDDTGKSLAEEANKKTDPADKKITELIIERFDLLKAISYSISWDDRFDKNRKSIEDILKRFHLAKVSIEKLTDDNRGIYYLNAIALFTVNYYNSRDARFFNAVLFAYDSLQSGGKFRAGELKLASLYLKVSALLFLERIKGTGFHPMPLGGYL